MDVIYGLENWQPTYPRVYIALGNFDGVHRGHQEIIRSTLKLAAAKTGTAAVMVFDPHPEKALKPNTSLPLLTTMAERERLLAKMGVDVLLVARFNKIMSKLAPREFIVDILKHKLGVQGVVVGYNYRFGRGGAGTPELLRRLGEDVSIEVTVVPPVFVRGCAVSSTIIRHLLREGKIRAGNSLLGRHYRMEGKVIHGAQRGRYLGFPTANLHGTENCVLGNGVYLVRCRWADRILFGAANVGSCPTFGQGEIRVEINLLDFRGELYGEQLTVEFLDFLRPERRFASPRDLRAQIARDIQQAREIMRSSVFGV